MEQSDLGQGSVQQWKRKHRGNIYIFLYIMVQLSRLNCWYYLIKLTEDFGGIGRVTYYCYIFVHYHPINIIWNVAKISGRRYMYDSRLNCNSLDHVWISPHQFHCKGE